MGDLLAKIGGEVGVKRMGDRRACGEGDGPDMMTMLKLPPRRP